MTQLPSVPERLAYVQSGVGEPVLLIHGIYGTGCIFDPLRSALDARYTVIAPDMRGHGNSASIAGAMDAAALASDLAALLDHLGLDAVHVLGYSHGGATAQALARLAPERVRSLTLISTYACQPLTRWERVSGWLMPTIVRSLTTPVIATGIRFGRSSARGPRLTAAQARTFSREVARNRASRMASAFATARSFDSRSWLAALTMPTLVIHGDADLMVSPRQGTVLVDGIPRASLVTIPEAGHLGLVTHEDEIIRMVSAWLAGHASVNATPQGA